jgi:hypothetical protein
VSEKGGRSARARRIRQIQPLKQAEETRAQPEAAAPEAAGSDERQLLAMSARLAGNAATASLSRQLLARRTDAAPTMGGQIVNRLYAGAAPGGATLLREKVKHTEGKTVDTYASADPFLKAYVKTKIEGGTKAEGHVHIQNAADFKKKTVEYLMAHLNEATSKTYTKAEAEAFEPDINAYQDAGEIYIHEERGETGTAIHESMHLYANDSYVSTLGFNINEGTTEYFTRVITAEQKITRGSFYPSQYASVNKLVGATSKDTLADAYFNGKIKEMGDAVEGKAKGAWASWKDFMKKGKYSDADALL